MVTPKFVLAVLILVEVAQVCISVTDKKLSVDFGRNLPV